MCVLLGVATVGIAGCSGHPAQTPDERLQQQAAQGAKELHHDVKQAGQDARKALSNAGRDTRDIVAGARQGWAEGREKDGPLVGGKVDLNHASLAELEKLPGVHRSMARAIEAHRPYGQTEELVKDGVLSQAQFDRIHLRVTAH